MSLPVWPSLVKGLTFTVTKAAEFNTIPQRSPNLYNIRISQSQNPIWHWTMMYDYLYDYFASPNNTYPYAPYSDYKTLQGFFLQQLGSFGAFLFSDPDDNFVGPGISTVPWSARTQYWIGASILDPANHWQQVVNITSGFSGATIPTFNDTGGTVVDSGVTWQDMGSGFSAGVPNIGGVYENGIMQGPATLQVVNDGAGNYYSPIQRNFGGLFWEDITDLDGSITVYLDGAVTSAYSIGGPGLALPNASYEGLYLAWNAPAGSWVHSHSYSLGNEILDPAGHVQKVTTAGTSGSSEPSWNDTGGTTTDNGVTWTDQGYNGGPSGVLTCNFNFYFQVCFEGDTLDFEKWMGSLWGIGDHGKNGQGTLKLMSSRPPTS